ncbi:kinase-like protein [Gigaspora margarita]|uniref:Kinase-like protein n=1 Tax=Gigaspora margarita TaxID=4874 RepID=A0A8H4B688_GIGMA|nr:kinase-like protein [Gigaspora margarita]
MFLHEQNIIHRDLHTKNILVDDRGTMLISDFGHSIHVDDSNSIEEIYAMPPFTDPQCLMGLKNKLTKKSDIYSLGVIFWEISSGKVPFENKTIHEIIPLICQGKREAPIENTPIDYIELYERCWDQDPINRPEINTIVNELDSLIFTTNLVNGTNSFVEPQSLQVLPQIAERTSDNCYCKMNPINQINPDQYSLFTGYTQYYA